MSITREEFKFEKKQCRYDSDKKVWVGYRIDVKVAGKRYRTVFATRRKAEAFIDELKHARAYTRAGLKAPSSARKIILRDLVEARLESIKEYKRKMLETRVLNYFMDAVGPFVAVEDLNLTHLRDFVKKRSKDLTPRKEAVKPQTVDRELAAIASMLHNAGDYFDELETYVAPRIPHPAFRKGQRERVITEAECEKLLGELYAIRPAFAKIFEFASLTGLRHSEIMRLRKTDLNRKARSLKVYRSKTDTTSDFSPLTDRMLELLDESNEGLYFFTPDGKTPGTFYKYLKRACDACGIPYGRYEPGAIILHDTRHSFVTKLQQAGIDLATIQSFSGHADKTLVLRYSHARPESRRKAMEAIDGTDRELELRKIFEKTRNNELTIEEFLAAVKR